MLDILEELCRKIRPYETAAGETNRVFSECVEWIAAASKQGLGKMIGAFRRAIEAFRGLRYDRSRRKPRVLVTGELLVNFHPGTNFHVEEYLERNDMEVILPRITYQFRKDFQAAISEIRDFGAHLAPYPFALDGAVEFYYENDLSTKLVEPLLEEIAQASGVHLYTVWELFLIQAAKPAREGYLEKGVPEDIVWDTWEDLKYKAIECKNVQGVWGNFVAHWYPIFFSNDIVKLGRLEYENVTYEGEVPYEKNGCVVRPGDKVKSVHIPSSGEPFDQAARLASYKKAYQFFKEELQGGPLVCVCGSWLLYPPYRGILSPTSNVVSFAGDWDILSSQESEEFHDAWRVFGAASKLPPEQWPEDTSMRRAYKKWILEGHKAGSGFGVLLFDGEKILNQ